jgi:hypothetical protein
MFTGGVLQVFKNVNKTGAMSSLQSELHVAFSRLDKEIRYASAISQPNAIAVAGNYYVEYLISNSSAATCVQLRLNGSSDQLERRSWTRVTGSMGPATAWLPIASGISSGVTAESPFALTTASGNYTLPRLKIRLRAEAGAGSDVNTRATEYSFAALNAASPRPTPTGCMEGRP